VSADPVDPPFCYIVNFDKQTTFCPRERLRIKQTQKSWRRNTSRFPILCIFIYVLYAGMRWPAHICLCSLGAGIRWPAHIYLCSLGAGIRWPEHIYLCSLGAGMRWPAHIYLCSLTVLWAMLSFLFDVTMPAGVQRDGVGRHCLLSLGNVIFSVTVPADVQRRCRPALLSLGNVIFSLRRDGASRRPT